METKMPTVTLRDYIDQRFDDSDKAVQAALVAQEKAILKAESAAERRFELLNELRQGVATKDQIVALEKVVDDLKTSRDTGTGKGLGLHQGWVILIGFFGLIGSIIGVISYFN